MRDDYAKQYGDFQRWHWWFRGRRKIIESILEHNLSKNTSRNILSVGCGPAEGIDWLLPFAGKEGTVTGLDIEEIHLESKVDRVCFINGKLQEAPFASGSFDVVMALDVLEHIEDDVSGLREAIRLVKRGGLVLVTVPALPSLWGGQDVVSQHYRRYTRRTLSLLFDQATSTHYDIGYFNTLLFPMIASVRWTSRALRINRSDNELKYSKPGLTNNILAQLFAAESRFINRTTFPIGVSLVATYRPG